MVTRGEAVRGEAVSLPFARPTDAIVEPEELDEQVVGGCALEVVVVGKPRGAKRPHVTRNRHTGDVLVLTADSHVEHEERIRMAAELAQGGPLGAWQPLEGIVAVELTAWFTRPGKLRRVKDRGSPPMPYRGKPDADNIGKLAMDALTRAGTYRDDTQVADLVVRRRYLALDLEGNDVGLERTEIRVLHLGGAR